MAAYGVYLVSQKSYECAAAWDRRKKIYVFVGMAEKRQKIIALIALVLIIPTALITGHFIHISILCRLLRISAMFSVVIVLFALYMIIICLVINKNHEKQKKAAVD